MDFKKHYNRIEYKKINKFRKEAILSLINKEKPVILDIGCSNGMLGSIIKKEKNAYVVGIDVSENAIHEASNVLDQACVVNLEDDLNFDFKNKKYDFIIISEVLEHLLWPEKVLEKIKGLSSEDIEIIITVPNLLFWKNRLKMLLGSFEYKDTGIMDRGHIHFFSWKSLKGVVEASGYKIIEERHHAPTRIFKLISKYFPGLFAYQFIIKIKPNNS